MAARWDYFCNSKHHTAAGGKGCGSSNPVPCVMEELIKHHMHVGRRTWESPLTRTSYQVQKHPRIGLQSLFGILWPC